MPVKLTQKSISVIIRFINKLILGTAIPQKTNRNLFKEEKNYLLKIWNNSVDKDYGIERIVKLFLSISRFFFPGLYIRILLQKLFGYTFYRIGVEFYILFKFILPFIIFYYNLDSNFFFLCLTIYLLLETFLYLLGKVYFGHLNEIDEVFYLRHITLLIINFFEINLSFALIYSYFYKTYPDFFNIKNGILSKLDLIYFSFITAGTVGYGDIHPIHPYGKLLAIFQICVFFLFVTILINNRTSIKFTSKK